MTKVFIPHSECWISSGACLEEGRCLQKCKAAELLSGAAPASLWLQIEQLLDSLSQKDDPCESIDDAVTRVKTLRTTVDRLQRAEKSQIDAALAAAPAATSAPAGWRLVPIKVPESAFPWVSGGYEADYKASNLGDQKVIEDRAQRIWQGILDGIAAPAHPAAQGTGVPTPGAAAGPAHSVGYFSYDNELGFERYETAEMAQAEAQNTLDRFREEAGAEGWSAETHSICWGVILGEAVEVPPAPGMPLTTVLDGETVACVDFELKSAVAPAAPVAYAVFADNGNIRIWSRDPREVEGVVGLSDVVPLYAGSMPVSQERQ